MTLRRGVQGSLLQYAAGLVGACFLVGWGQPITCVPFMMSATIAGGWGFGSLFGVKRRLMSIWFRTSITARKLHNASDPSWLGALWGWLVLGLTIAVTVDTPHVLRWADGFSMATTACYCAAKIVCYERGCCRGRTVTGHWSSLLILLTTERLPSVELGLGVVLLLALVIVRSTQDSGAAFSVFAIFHGTQLTLSRALRGETTGLHCVLSPSTSLLALTGLFTLMNRN